MKRAPISLNCGEALFLRDLLGGMTSAERDAILSRSENIGTWHEKPDEAARLASQIQDKLNKRFLPDNA